MIFGNYVTIILVILTLMLQSVGMTLLIHWFRAQFPEGIHQLGVFRSMVLVVRFTGLLVCLHILEILLWASFYRWKCFATWEAAFYFSAASYSTVGSGDLLLKQIWRTIGPIESVMGVLMCGLSASFLFAIVTRLVHQEDPGVARSPRRRSGSNEWQSQRTDLIETKETGNA
jgi:hypothetical protein